MIRERGWFANKNNDFSKEPSIFRREKESKFLEGMLLDFL